MNYFYLYKTIGIVAIILHTTALIGYPAIVTVPIADLVGAPLPLSKYEELPLCGGMHASRACPRLHQALFNQYVEVVEERNNLVCIAVPNIFYITNKARKPHHQFWTAADSITPLHILEKRGIARTTFPSAITAATKSVPENQIVTLIEPFYDAVTGFTFSAGTRFAQAVKKTDAHSIAVYRYNPKTKSVSTLHIPKKECISNQRSLTPAERIDQFVTLARQWAQQDKGAIPYVWGGYSYTERSAPDNFTEVVVNETQPYSYYVRPDYTHRQYAGLDCSGFICLAAQCCGIPYFFKNSTTAFLCLEPITHHASLIPGDIIWMPNHVMIVGSLTRSTLIEARHYAQGYGRIQELPLSAVFKGIKNYQDLYEACATKKPLVRLDSKGNERETIREYALLDIMSVFKT